MHIELVKILVSSSIALLLSGWSFLICYFLFSKARPIFYVWCVIAVVLNLVLSTGYLTGMALVLTNTVITLVMATVGSTLQSLLNRKYKVSKDGYFAFFGIHCVAVQLPLLFTVALWFFNNNPIIDFFIQFAEGKPLIFLLLYVGPSLSVIPLYMFKTYRPRLGMDTHFPDAGNN